MENSKTSKNIMGAPVKAQADFETQVRLENVKGYSVLITGGAAGIGGSIARAFAEAGAYVTIADIKEAEGGLLAETLSSTGKYAQFIKTDVTSHASQVKAFKAAIQFNPQQKIDIVIPAAGVIGQVIPQLLPTDATSDPVEPPTLALDVNLKAVYFTAAIALHYFAQQAERAPTSIGQLIFIASQVPYMEIPLIGEYLTSKMGVRGLWWTLKNRTEMLHCRTNMICPFWVRTPMTQLHGSILEKAGVIFGEAEDVAKIVIRVSCDPSIDGRAIAVAKGKGYDLCDDIQDMNGAKVMKDLLEQGIYGDPTVDIVKILSSL